MAHRMKSMFAAWALTMAGGAVNATDPAPPDYRWWQDARFGMFIHWGLYSEAGGVWKEKFIPGWSEWMLNRRQIPPGAYYETLMPRYDPSDFDAEAWVRLAKEAGMKYIVITTKHHEGFANFPSAVTERDIAATRFGMTAKDGGRGRDPLKELAAACEREGIRLGFYYSLLDWAHPDYLPRRDWDKRPIDGANYAAYTTFMKEQVRELLDGRYGKVAILWGDGDWEHSSRAHGSEAIVEMARELQPGILVNDRWAMPGDYATPENKIPDEGPARPWETCMTLNGSWGYARDDHDFKSSAEVLRNLADIISKGGNYLLNIGPDGKGRIDDESAAVLRGIGAWMKTHEASIRGNGVAPLAKPAWGRWTIAQRSDGSAILSAHLFAAPDGGVIRLEGFAGDPRVITVPGREFAAPTWKRDGQDLVLQLSPESSAAMSSALPHPVVAVEFASMPRSAGGQTGLGDAGPVLNSSSLPYMPAHECDGLSQGLNVRVIIGDYKEVPGADAFDLSKTSIEVASVTLPQSLPEDRFAIRFTGLIEIPESGIYRFELTSDDGSELWLDGTRAIDNGGLHGPVVKVRDVALAKGCHAIDLRMFESSGSDWVQLRWRLPGATEFTSIPAAAYSRRSP